MAEQGERQQEDILRRGREAESAVATERLTTERGGGVPLLAPDIIAKVDSAEIKDGGDISEVEKAVVAAESFKIGLDYGPKGVKAYDIDTNPGAFGYLFRKFTSAEASTKSPESAYYIDFAIQNAIGGRIRPTEEWIEDKEGWKQKQTDRVPRRLEVVETRRLIEGEAPFTEEQRRLVESALYRQIAEQERSLSNIEAAIPRLQELQNTVDAVDTIHHAFVQREQAAGSPEAFANMVDRDRNYRLPATPDIADWRAFFDGRDGETKDRLLRTVVRAGMPAEGQRYPIIQEGVRDERIAGVPAAIYASGFENRKVFANYFNVLKWQATGRVDLAWQSWMVAKIWEIPAQLGIALKVSHDGRKTFAIAVPPLSNAIGPWHMHLREKQYVEWGLDADGKRKTVDRYGTHAGHPIFFLGPERLRRVIREASAGSDNAKRFIDKFKDVTEDMLNSLREANPCQSFLHETTVRLSKEELVKTDSSDKLRTNLTRRNLADTDPQSVEKKKYRELLGQLNAVMNGKKDSIEISLWDLWWWGEVSFANPDFPWLKTAVLDPDKPGAELEPGSYENWLLRRYRTQKIVTDIRTVYLLKDLASPTFFRDRSRDWSKVWGSIDFDKKPADKGYLHPAQNPRVWFLLQQLVFHSLGPVSQIPIVNLNKSELEARTLLRDEGPDVDQAGMAAGPSHTTFDDIFLHAESWGFLRVEDTNFICTLLGIRPPKRG